jgi:hypothetical protein
VIRISRDSSGSASRTTRWRSSDDAGGERIGLRAAAKQFVEALVDPDVGIERLPAGTMDHRLRLVAC